MTQPPLPILAVRNLQKQFGKHPALSAVSFEVARGEVFGLLGPNGSGKSTTFRVLCGLIRAEAGVVERNGVRIDPTAPAAREGMGVAFQHPSLDSLMSARENLAMGAALYALPKDLARKRIADALQSTGLADRADEPVRNFSGGMRRKLELARVLLAGPELLLLDEPTQGLDRLAFARFWEELHRLRRERNLTILVTTHDAEEADQCERVAVLDEGRVVACGTPADLRAQIGGDVVTLRAENAAAAAGKLKAGFGVEPAVRGEEIRFTREQAHELVPRLVEALGEGALKSVTVQRPSLADLFYRLTGRFLEEDEAAAEDAA